jgi:hypothetical protein
VEFDTTKTQLGSEKEKAILSAENALRDQLSEEWMVRLKLEVDGAWEQSSGKKP